jgi:hypothetical protein
MNSGVFRNTGFGGGLYVTDHARVTISNSSQVHNNSGGGLAASKNATVLVAGNTSVHNNSAFLGGGLTAGGASSVTITRNSKVHGNTALTSGGGVSVSGAAKLTVSGRSTIYNNLVRENSWSLPPGGGGLHVTANATAFIMKGSSIRNNTCQDGMGGGISVGLLTTGRCHWAGSYQGCNRGPYSACCNWWLVATAKRYQGPLGR